MIAVYILLGLVGLFGLCVLFSWIYTLFIDTTKEYSKDSRLSRWLLYRWSGFMVFVMRIRIKKTGMDKLPKGRFLLVQNHRSNFDPILTWYVLRKYNLSFLSKEANFHIFVFGKLIRRCCFRVIDRENPKNALKTIYDAAELAKNDVVSIGVYPEGTRNKNSDETALLPFHNGVFKIAQRAGIPIVVTTIKGTESIHSNFPLHSSHVEFDILKVINPEDIAKVRTEAIGAEVEAAMLENLK